MKDKQRILANADIAEIILAPPPGHQHLRATIRLQTGEEFILQEATVANLVRAYVGIKTHPQRNSCRLVGRELSETEKKRMSGLFCRSGIWGIGRSFRTGR